jgi:hypothetical protein
VLRRIFGPKRDEVTGEWRRLHNEELYALYSSPNIIWVIKSRRLRWAGHIERMGASRDYSEQKAGDNTGSCTQHAQKQGRIPWSRNSGC